MKRKFFSKFLGIALVASMTMGLVACGEQNAVNGSSTSTETTVASETANAGTEVASSEVEEVSTKITYPVDTDVKLNYWSSAKDNLRPSSQYTDWTESPFHSGLEEQTGIYVDWYYTPAGTNASEAFNLLLTDTELPHIIWHNLSASKALELMEDGVIYDLTEYLPEYAPDYWEHINSDPNRIKSVQTEDGRVFGFGAFNEGDYNVTYLGPAIRQDWLDECGLKAPVTMEDWENVLVTFKEKYGARMGVSINNRFGNNAGIASGTDAMATFTATWYIDDNGKVQFAQAQPEWKEYMEWLNKWWEMGLIDEDSLTMDDAAVRTKVANNEIGVTVTAMSQISNFVADAESAGSSANWVGFEYPRTAAGEPTSMIQSGNNYLKWNAVITTACSEEELIAALQWLNYGYTEEGMMYWNFGTEGETYTVDADGNVSFTELVTADPEGLNKAVLKYTGVASAGLSVQKAEFVKLKNVPAAAEAVYAWIENTEAGKHYMPSMALSGDTKTRYNDLWSVIKTYVNETALKFLVGDESLDNFDAFVAELNKLGLEEAQQIQQEAYDKYLAR